MPVETVVAGLSGLGVLASFGIVLVSHQRRIKDVERHKQDRAACDEVVRRLEQNLGHGSGEFEKINGKVDALAEKTEAQGKDIAKIVERIDWIARVNGYKGGKDSA